MADLQGVLLHDDTFDEQLQEPLLLRQGGLLQPGADALAERLEVRPHLLSGVLLGAQPRLLLALGGEDLAAASDLLTTLFKLLQVDALFLVGVEQPLPLAVEPSQLPLPLLLLGPRVG